MSQKRRFGASDEIFSDYECYIDMCRVESLLDIVKEFKANLNETLEKHKLTALCNILSKKNFHIHGHSIEDILVSNKDNFFYVCSC